MKVIAALLLIIPAIAFANPPQPVNKTVKVYKPTQTTEVLSAAAADARAAATSEAVASPVANAYGATVDASSSVNVAAPRLAVAPDVFSYPTAPCRVAGGISGGWIGGAIGVSGSVEDPNCTVMEASRRLHDQGLKAAAVQIMCLIPDAKLALEATGTKCLIARPAAQEPTKP